MIAQLPEPSLLRWQPLRCGLLNLYKYDDQTFVFEGGRLLLRGNNGTGKSRALALTLPFLLDGETKSHRVEPDADQNKHMEWNLLMGKRDERTGYSWLEFGHKTPEGDCEYLTLGCGLRASEGRQLQRWFFITPLRIGCDLRLAKNRTPHIEASLEQELAGKGEIFHEAKRYRAAVDQRLFGLGIVRYEALLNLLIQLRKPQLTRKLDEEQLSQALSEALPPLSKQVLDDVAEAFRELDEQREQLAVFRGAHDAVDEFLEKYRHYVQVAARMRARAVTGAHRQWNDTQRQARHHQQVREQAEADRALRQAEMNDREVLASELTAKAGVLKEDPALKDMERAQHEAADTKRHAADMQTERNASEERFHDSEEELKRVSAHETEALNGAAAAAKSASTEAEKAFLQTAHGDALDALDLSTLESETSAVAARSSLAEPVSRRRKALNTLQTLVGAVALAEQALGNAKIKSEEMASGVTSAEEDESAAHQRMVAAAEALTRIYRNWVAGLQELRPLDVDHFDEALDSWLEHRSGVTPLSEAVAAAHGDAQRLIASKIATVQQSIDAAKMQEDQLGEILNALREGRHEPPPLPPTRDQRVRESVEGAAFWQLCDFHDGMAAEGRANIEAALEAAGLLDAWVLPNGELLGPDYLDASLHAPGSSPAPEGRTLASALRVDVENLPPGFSVAIVDSILSRIGFGVESGGVWVAADGQWQIGPLRGTWRKLEAQHIGASAREAERLRRIESVTRDLTAVQVQCDALRGEFAAVIRRRDLATAESKSAPTDDEVRDAGLSLDFAKRQLAQARERLTAAEAQVRKREAERAERVAHRDKDARDFGLFDHLARLDELQAALHEYEKALLKLWPAVENLARSRRQTAHLRERAETDRAYLTRRSELYKDAHQKAAAANSRLETLRSTVGADVDELLLQLSQTEAELTDVQAKIKLDQTAIGGLIAAAAEAKALHDAAEGSLVVHEQARAREANYLIDFARHRLLAVAHDDFRAFEAGDRTTAEMVSLAREVDRTLQSVPFDSDHWNDQVTSIHSHVETLRAELLPHNYAPATSQTLDGVLVVSVPYQGSVCTMTEVSEAFATEITTREGQLTRDERRVIEKYLLKEAAHELHQRLHAAEAWRDGASEQLQSRPMGSGMRLRFAWEPRGDGPTGLREAIKLLRRHSATWSEKESQDLGAFLGDRIREAHRASEGGKWEDHLAKALDYRAWHLFTVERWQDGRWERLTKKRHGTGSGGEKAVALTLPQFTAAATFYGSAPLAPRLILLDEAFVGVDSDMRRKCMDLLATFDLDLVMTSEREWGCYPTVPALAIYQLASAPEVDAIAATRWVWNGRDDPHVDERLHIGASDE